MEEWRDIDGYEGLYQISNIGRVKSFDRVVRTFGGYRTIGGRIIKPHHDKDGYWRIGLSKDRKQKQHYVHRLVAKAFLENPDNLPVINHKNEIKDDDRVENLEWCTIYYNSVYNGKMEKLAKLRWKKVIQYDMNGNFIREWDSIKEASYTLGIRPTGISSCCTKRYSQSGGFVWRYKNNENI